MKKTIFFLLSYFLCNILLAACNNSKPQQTPPISISEELPVHKPYEEPIQQDTITHRPYTQAEAFRVKLENTYYLSEVRYLNQTDTLGIGICTPQRKDFIISPDTLFESSIQVESYYTETQPFLAPYFNEPGLGIFHFVTLKEGKDYYEIRLLPQENGYVRKEDFNFSDWNTFLHNMYAVYSAEADISGQVINVEGDWIEVKTFTEDDQYEATGEIARIQWKKDNNILVDIYFTP